MIVTQGQPSSLRQMLITQWTRISQAIRRESAEVSIFLEEVVLMVL